MVQSQRALLEHTQLVQLPALLTEAIVPFIPEGAYPHMTAMMHQRAFPACAVYTSSQFCHVHSRALSGQCHLLCIGQPHLSSN